MLIITKFTNLNNALGHLGTNRLYKSAPDPPPAPDYIGAAQQTATGNLEAARAAASANRVNQYTPYGSTIWSKDPMYGSPDEGWTQRVTLAPEQQQLLNTQNQTSIGLGNLANQGLGYVKDALGHPVNQASLGGDIALPANMVNAGQTGQDALMARFQPQIDQSRAALQTQLANQGIAQGSEAYTNAMRTQNQSENDLRSQAALNGIDVGNRAQTQQLNNAQSQNQLQQQRFELLNALQNQPVNMLNAVRTGSQVTNPQFSSYAQQGQTAGPDLLGAAGQQNQYNMGLYNSQVAGANSGNSGMMGALGTIGTVAAVAF